MVDDILLAIFSSSVQLKKNSNFITDFGNSFPYRNIDIAQKKGLLYRRLEVTEDPTIKRNVEKKNRI